MYKTYICLCLLNSMRNYSAGTNGPIFPMLALAIPISHRGDGSPGSACCAHSGFRMSQICHFDVSTVAKAGKTGIWLALTFYVLAGELGWG